MSRLIFHAGLLLGLGGPVSDGVTSTQFGVQSTTHNVSMPASVASGDLLLCLFSSPQPMTVTTPSGWTAESGSLTMASGCQGAWFSKVASGSEGGTTVNFATSISSYAVAMVLKVKAGTYSTALPPDIAVLSTATTTTPDPPLVAASWGTDSTLWIAAASIDNEPTVSAFPSGYTDATSNRSTAGAGGTSGVASAVATVIKTAASEDPGAFSISATQPTLQFSVAIPPAGISISTPTISSPTTSQFTTGATAHAVNTPAVVAGDRLICALFVNGGTITTPAGWTLLGSVANTGRLALYYRDEVSTIGATTYNFVTSAAQTGCAEVWKVAAGTFDASAAPEYSISAPASNTLPMTPVLSPSWGSGSIATGWLAVCGKSSAAGAVAPTAAYLSMHRDYTTVTGASGAAIYAGRRVQKAASSVPVGWEFSSGTGVVTATVAIKPV